MDSDNVYNPMTANEAGRIDLQAQNDSSQVHPCGDVTHPLQCSCPKKANETGKMSMEDNPLTANEAGRCYCGTMDCDSLHLKDTEFLPPPSKPCTEGGDHCFCVLRITRPMIDRGGAWHQCCWCGAGKTEPRIPTGRQSVPGHGKYRTEPVGHNQG